MNDADQQFECKRTSELERKALEEFFAIYMKDTDRSYFVKNHTDSSSESDYDCMVYQYSKLNETITHRYIFEVKIRASDYPTLLLEKNKYNKLISYYGGDCRVYYINFTPKHTVMFNLGQLRDENKLNFIKENHNRVTVNKSLGKVQKEIAYLDIKLGNIFPFVFDPSK